MGGLGAPVAHTVKNPRITFDYFFFDDGGDDNSMELFSKN